MYSLDVCTWLIYLLVYTRFIMMARASLRRAKTLSSQFWSNIPWRGHPKDFHRDPRQPTTHHIQEFQTQRFNMPLHWHSTVNLAPAILVRLDKDPDQETLTSPLVLLLAFKNSTYFLSLFCISLDIFHSNVICIWWCQIITFNFSIITKC